MRRVNSLKNGKPNEMGIFYPYVVIFLIGSISLGTLEKAHGSNRGSTIRKQKIEHLEYFSDDTIQEHIVELPFYTEKEYLAPAVCNDYLYCIKHNVMQKKNKFSLWLFPLAALNSHSDSIGVNIRQDSKFSGIYVNFCDHGETVLLTTLDKKDDQKKLFIGKTKYINELDSLKAFPYNSNKYSIGRATISPNGQLLVFSSDRPGALGETDLWMCRKEGEGWAQPQNLGAVINTEMSESMPFFYSDSCLFFASTGHDGYGGYDLFYSNMTGGVFDIPVNLGKEFNSPGNETGITYAPGRGLFYFASDRAGFYDIYACRADVLNNKKQFFSDLHLLFSDDKMPEKEKVVPDTLEVENTVEELSVVDDFFLISQPIELPVDKKTKADVDLDSLSAKEQNSDSLLFIDESKEKIGILKPFYAVQMIAVKENNYNEKFLNIFLTGREGCFLIKEDGWVKVRIGRFSTYKEAIEYSKQEKIKPVYIVRMFENQIERTFF